ncbi:MAG: SoxAX cytochrome complex subunit A [Gammaproteobacteria bacterium]|nr:MAG: sulfur oxidation c-type cytochrome SoxA [Gammaproteobacteria bacterium TMED257]CAI8293565.1 MAG: SoxAX cytochrome complex subunit A [Gammaproteobacteria bacterium]|tara:strand:- start:178 stop:1011 length:834 start_codon:yes stop_codon:yes gene_type:complete
MKSNIQKIMLIVLFFNLTAYASPEEDLEIFRDHFKKRFPNTEFSDYKNGVYSIDSSSREQWESIEDFPPYELNIEQGEELFNTPFKNGNSYASCFENGGIGIRSNYPYFDEEKEQVVTLEQDINECRKKNGEKPLSYYKGGPMADISAYMAYTSRGNIINVEIPNNDKAIDAYEMGRKLYFTKVGQLNFSCADCHVYQTGSKLRADIPSPGIGHPTHFPAYRSSAGRLVTLHERFAGCLNRVRAKPFKAQNAEYRNLEYFMTFMSNGLEINGPGSRK